ncbi:MAG: hypothetical protein AAGA08_16185 [Pseudomonadota bacterium]
MKAICVAALVVWPIASQAQDVCGALQAHLNGAAVRAEIPKITGIDPSCRSSLAQSGATSLHCGWPFQYRASQAKDAFLALVEDVQACLGPDASRVGDPKVNHPDFYELQVFGVAEGEVGVSLKDKASLQKTYVFLRITPASPS